MYQDLRADGFDAEAVQLWVVGYPGEESLLASVCAGMEHPCFIADQAYLDAYTPDKDDVYVNDATGHGIKWGNLNYSPLDQTTNYDTLDALLRSLL